MSTTAMRTHQCGELRPEHIGQTVSLCGWVATRREHGERLAFVDLRDHTGVTQCVVDNSVDVRAANTSCASPASSRLGPPRHVNDRLPTGEIELAGLPGRDPQHRRAAAVPDQRARRHRRREDPPAVSLPRHPP